MAATTVGLISLPAWATGWHKCSFLPGDSLLPADQHTLLADVAETIIPATPGNAPGTVLPGAKALGIPDFIQKMVTDCYEPVAQKTLTNGLTTVDDLARQRFGKPFAEGDATQRMEVLNQMNLSGDAGQKAFFSLVKNLTIRGYMSSEYVMTNLTHYEMVPGRYHGCVPVANKIVSEKQ